MVSCNESLEDRLKDFKPVETETQFMDDEDLHRIMIKTQEHKMFIASLKEKRQKRSPKTIEGYFKQILENLQELNKHLLGNSILKSESKGKAFDENIQKITQEVKKLKRTSEDPQNKHLPKKLSEFNQLKKENSALKKKILKLESQLQKPQKTKSQVIKQAPEKGFKENLRENSKFMNQIQKKIKRSTTKCLRLKKQTAKMQKDYNSQDSNESINNEGLTKLVENSRKELGVSIFKC